MTTDSGKRIGDLLGVPVAGVRDAGPQHGYRHMIAALTLPGNA